LFVEFSNVPSGASFSAGTQLPNGNWRVPAADLSNLTITPPEHSNVDFTINVQALSVESDGDQAYSAPLPISISLRGVPDAPVIISNSTVGDEDTAIPVNFEVASGDTDGSETLSYVI
jgi:CCR4-NOT transcriptional regulation complex NOT5 subunit